MHDSTKRKFSTLISVNLHIPECPAVRVWSQNAKCFGAVTLVRGEKLVYLCWKFSGKKESKKT